MNDRAASTSSETASIFRRPGSITAITGFLLVACGLVVQRERGAAALLMAGIFVTDIALGSAVFVAINTLTSARWADRIRRAPEVLAKGLPFGLAMIAGATVVGGARLFPWMDHSQGAHSEAILAKGVWFSRPFFFARMFVIFAVWLLLVRRVMVADRDAARDRADAVLGSRSKKGAVVFVIVFALTYSVASFDWTMSLEPGWSSTIYGVYGFAGLFVSALAAITVVSHWGTRGRDVPDVHEKHDLGKLVFAFAFFWGYIWFCQWMLVWYGNIAEEASYYVDRNRGAWASVTILLLLTGFVAPFVALVSHHAKKNETILLRASVTVLLGHWLDLYVRIFPAVSPKVPPVSAWEIGAFLLAIAYLRYTVWCRGAAA